jgi:hypothetical protein
MRLLLRSSTALWRRVFRRELLRRYSDFRREGNFPESKLSGFCSGGIRKYAEHLRKNIPAEHHVGVDQLLFCSFYFPQIKIEYRRSKNCSAGNPPPRGNPGIKRTRTDAILKKFEFKKNFKLKINVKRDRTNFRSIQ